MTTRNGVTSSRELVLEALREGERFVLTTHEHPDGDALGSLAAMQGVMCALGKDAFSFLRRTSSRCRTSTASSSCRSS